MTQNIRWAASFNLTSTRWLQIWVFTKDSLTSTHIPHKITVCWFTHQILESTRPSNFNNEGLQTLRNQILVFTSTSTLQLLSHPNKYTPRNSKLSILISRCIFEHQVFSHFVYTILSQSVNRQPFHPPKIHSSPTNIVLSVLQEEYQTKDQTRQRMFHNNPIYFLSLMSNFTTFSI